MRHALGLDLPERRIGLSAHDFAQLLGAKDVILSHAAKVGGAPAVASRFLHRLEAVAGEERWKAAIAAGEHYVRFAGELDRPDADRAGRAARAEAAARRAAAKTVGHRDRGLAARSLYDLRQIYPEARAARSRRHAVVGGRPGIGDPRRARRIHANLCDDAARPIPRRVLRAIGEKYFAPLMERPEARALWWPRFQRIADWFAGWETGRRADISAIAAEIRGEISIRLDNERSFRAVGARRPDRTPPRRHAMRSSTTRPGSRRPASRCAWGCRRN